MIPRTNTPIDTMVRPSAPVSVVAENQSNTNYETQESRQRTTNAATEDIGRDVACDQSEQ